MNKMQRVIYEEAKEREPRLKEKVLSALQNAGSQGVTNVKLNSVSIRFGHFIYLLKIDGYDIDVENVGDGVVKYTLRDTPLKKIKYEKGIDVLKREIVSKHNNSVTYEELELILDAHNFNIVRKPNTLS